MRQLNEFFFTIDSDVIVDCKWTHPLYNTNVTYSESN